MFTGRSHMYSSNLSFIKYKLTIAVCVPSIVVNFNPVESPLKLTSESMFFKDSKRILIAFV